MKGSALLSGRSSHGASDLLTAHDNHCAAAAFYRHAWLKCRASEWIGLHRMTKNSTIIVVALVCLALGAGGYWVYQDQQRSGIDVNLGGTGITIQTR